MTALHQCDHGFVRVVELISDATARSAARLLTVSQPVDHGHEQTARVRMHQVPVA
jgi:hypothetical protein